MELRERKIVRSKIKDKISASYLVSRNFILKKTLERFDVTFQSNPIGRGIVAVVNLKNFLEIILVRFEFLNFRGLFYPS